MEMQDKVVVITGGSGGIGRAMARAFLENGAKAIMLADLDEGAIETVEFDRPFKAGNMAITSAPCLLTELEEINKLIGLDPSFRKKKMVDFMNAGLEDISKYESRAGTQEGFWARFFFVMLWKLVERSIENRLPAILT